MIVLCAIHCCFRINMQLFTDLSLCSMVEVAVVTALFLAARSKPKKNDMKNFLAAQRALYGVD